MQRERDRISRGALAPLALILLSASLAGAADRSSFRPNGVQVRRYGEAVAAWTGARREAEPEQSEMLRKAEALFEKAAQGPAFPEALLGLGLLRYSRGNTLGAERPLAAAAELARGAVRIEALTYVGLIALREGRWAEAKDSFEKAIREDPSVVVTSASGPNARRTVDELRERGEGAHRIARVGSVLSSFYSARATGASPSSPEEGRELAAEIDRLLPPGDPHGVGPAFNGSHAALWAFNEQDPDWSRSLADGLPPGARAIDLPDLVQSLRLWAAGDVALDPSLPPPAELTDAQRRTAAAALLKQARRLEAEGRTRETVPLWERLAHFPETALAARQQRVWILLQPPAGTDPPAAADIDAARALIRGPLAAEDPLLFEEQLALASAIQRAAGSAGSAALAEAAAAELRLILTGVPGAPGRAAPEEIRRTAELNLAALATGGPGARDTAFWERSLAEFPPRPGRESVRLHMAVQLAEAALRARQAPLVMRALALADEAAAGREVPGGQAVPGGDALMRSFRRYLASLAFQLNDADRYADSLLKQTEFSGEQRAFEAAEQFRKWLEETRDRPPAPAAAAEAWNRILETLRTARGLAAENAALRARLDVDIAVSRAYLAAIEAQPAQVHESWNAAAGRTNSARTAADWDMAEDAWRVALGHLQDRPAGERREAALHLVNCRLKRAEALYRAGDRTGARTALREARAALGSGPGTVGAHLAAEDVAEILRLVDRNARALEPAEMLVPARRRNVTGYAGGLIPPLRAPHVIIRYRRAHDPDVRLWLAQLERTPGAVRRLVDWFNNGPVARSTPDAKRDFSADPRSPNYLVAFLRENIHPVPGRLLPGETQWHDHSGAGPWASATVEDRTAGYYLKNGVALIRAACSNPLAVVRVSRNEATWVDRNVSAPLRTAPRHPTIAYERPRVEFLYSSAAAAQAYTMERPVMPQVSQAPPALRVLAEPRVVPPVSVHCLPIGI